MESPPMFNSVEDECRYWKERAKLYHKEWTDVKQEYDEYVEQSRQMEAEMDATLDQKQGIIKDLRMKVTSLEKENESLKLKLDSHSIDYTNVEKQLETVKIERDSMKEYLRQLEQKNDDLERAHRILNESIVDFERMLDKAYEKNAMLEMEVDEKEVLQEKLQRLMDETRDLKQELNVKSRYTANGATNNSIANGLLNNGDALMHDATTTSTNTIATNTTINNCNNSTTPAVATNNINDYNQQHTLKRKPFPDPDNLLNGNAMTASSRTTALNIVADMLRKLNLDKALLCPECQKFRCVCDRISSSPSAADNAQCGQSSVANNNNVGRTFANTFGGSSHAVNTSTSTTTAIATPTATATRTVESDRGASGAADSGSMLNRSSSRSFSNLNFSTNIFKRFAERMSGNANVLTTPTHTLTTISLPTLTTPTGTLMTATTNTTMTMTNQF